MHTESPLVPSCIDRLDVRGCFAPSSEPVKPGGFIPAHTRSFQPGEMFSLPTTEGLNPTPAPGMGVPSEIPFLERKGLRGGVAGGAVGRLTAGQSLCPPVPPSMRSPHESRDISKGAWGEINKHKCNIFLRHQDSISAGWLGFIKPLITFRKNII